MSWVGPRDISAKNAAGGAGGRKIAHTDVIHNYVDALRVFFFFFFFSWIGGDFEPRFAGPGSLSE